ncbi:MAG: septal ring lytic transglycosylase RlpA family protein [Pseudomonadota bacterium]
MFMTAAIASADAAPASCGKASWYAMTSLTASGERASPNTMTAAHKTLPFGTKVRVTNERNGKAVVVRINDRGPYSKGRIIDLTRAAAGKLGFVNAGWTNVKVEPLNKLDHPKVRTLVRNC